jgi:hypothetical protein
MVTIYGHILREAPDAWLVRPATRLEPDPPLGDPVVIPAQLAGRAPSHYGLDGLRVDSLVWLRAQKSALRR